MVTNSQHSIGTAAAGCPMHAPQEHQGQVPAASGCPVHNCHSESSHAHGLTAVSGNGQYSTKDHEDTQETIASARDASEESQKMVTSSGGSSSMALQRGIVRNVGRAVEVGSVGLEVTVGQNGNVSSIAVEETVMAGQ